jgi:hypothetical protein
MAFVNMFQWALHCLTDQQKKELEAKYLEHKANLEKELKAIQDSLEMLHKPPP